MTKSLTHDINADADNTHPPRNYVRKELTIAAIGISFGLIVLPAIIYAFGKGLLGNYSGGPHIGSFYGDYFRNLGDWILRTWALALGPYVIFMVVRLILWPWKRQPGPITADTTASEIAPLPPPVQRREPFIGS